MFILSTLKLQRLLNYWILTSAILSFIILNLWISLDMYFYEEISIFNRKLNHPSLRIDRYGYLGGDAKWLITTYAYLIKSLAGIMKGRLKIPTLVAHEFSELARQSKGWQSNLAVRSVDYFSTP